MPQYGRRKPFSNKKKKSQLQQKRQTHRTKQELQADDKLAKETSAALDVRIDSDGEESEDDDTHPEHGLGEDKLVDKLQAKFEVTELQKISDGTRKDRYKLIFAQETAEELEERKRQARHPVHLLSEKCLEVSYDDIYRSTQHVEMPCRPEWSYELSKQKLDAKERRYFNMYVDKLLAETHHHPLSYFELNLETWRQLWRVLEMSDVVIVISDARHPILHFPPSLYRHVVEDLKKTLVLLINKIDLVPASVILAWRQYFSTLFPSLHVVLYTAKPGNVSGSDRQDAKGLMSHSRGAKRRMICVGGARQLIRALADVCADSSLLTEWSARLAEFELADENSPAHAVEERDGAKAATSGPSYLTIGLVGHPNVGKSSLLNSLVGKKVVSCSRTPGHTKHFQTYFLTQHIRLCDCPGLVFPSRVEKQLQILSGMYPISQVREPYTSIGYLASRLGPSLLYRLGLVTKSKSGDGEMSGSCAAAEKGAASDLLEAGGRMWSAWDICEQWAEERGYYTAKGARPDLYRAANHILRLAVDGRICLFVRPPGYHSEIEHWRCHPDLESVAAIQTEGLDGAAQPPLSSQLAADISGDDSGSAAGCETQTDSSGEDDVVPVLSKNPFAQIGEVECE